MALTVSIAPSCGGDYLMTKSAGEIGRGIVEL